MSDFFSKYDFTASAPAVKRITPITTETTIAMIEPSAPYDVSPVNVALPLSGSMVGTGVKVSSVNGAGVTAGTSRKKNRNGEYGVIRPTPAAISLERKICASSIPVFRKFTCVVIVVNAVVVVDVVVNRRLFGSSVVVVGNAKKRIIKYVVLSVVLKNVAEKSKRVGGAETIRLTIDAKSSSSKYSPRTDTGAFVDPVEPPAGGYFVRRVMSTRGSNGVVVAGGARVGASVISCAETKTNVDDVAIVVSNTVTTKTTANAATKRKIFFIFFLTSFVFFAVKSGFKKKSFSFVTTCFDCV